MKKTLTRFKKNIELTLLAAPGILWFVIFCYIPMIGILLAFKNYIPQGNFITSLLKSEWVGFNNFKFVFQTNDAFIMIRNTILYNSAFILLNIVIPLLVAILLSELLNKRIAKMYQTMIFFPYFISWVVISYFLFAFLSPDKGVANQMLAFFGKEPVSWYVEKKYWPFMILFLSTWKMLGYNSVIYLSAIIGIDRTYYEAAALDGASKVQMALRITIPSLRPLIIVLFILAIGNVFKSDFGLFYQVPRNSGPLFPVTQTIDTYVYRAFRNMPANNVGMSSAVAFMQSVVGLIFVLVSNFFIRKIDKDSAIF